MIEPGGSRVGALVYHYKLARRVDWADGKSMLRPWIPAYVDMRGCSFEGRRWFMVIVAWGRGRSHRSAGKDE